MLELNNKFEAFPLGKIKPKGWLKNQLRIQGDGLSGHLEEHWEDVGKNNGWKGGDGESWERGPYYLDGLLPLAYLLEDQRLIDRANVWVEWTLKSQREDGSFGPMSIRTVNTDVSKKHDWWHYMIMLKALKQHKEVTGDIRVIPFLKRFFEYVNYNIEEMPLEGWAAARGSEMMLVLHWLYNEINEEWLLELSRKIVKQSIPWREIFYDFPFWRKVEEWDWRTHVVNVAMGIKMPGVSYELTGDEREKDSVIRGIESLMKYHGQAHGMFSGDEWLSGTHPSQGVELCAVVEYMYSLEHLTRIFGDGRFGDILEKVTFNALPAGISEDWTSHQYDQQVNQIICNSAERNWSNSPDANTFGLEPCFGCCTANMHQGWPKYTANMWMAHKRGGLVGISYAPCTLKTDLGSTEAVVEVSGEYPFREKILIEISLQKETSFNLRLRIPQWCQNPEIEIDGNAVEFSIEDGFALMGRRWSRKNSIQLHLPMKSKRVTRNNYTCSIERDPLLYVLPLKEQWYEIRKRARFSDWEIYPGSQWKYGILEDSTFEVEHSKIEYQPFQCKNPPVTIKAEGKLVQNWKMENNNAGAPPITPVVGEERISINLIPYGGAKLRIGEFPQVK